MIDSSKFTVGSWMRLSKQLRDALAEGVAARPGEKRERKDGYVWQKQRDGRWKRLHKAVKAKRKDEAKAFAADKAMEAKDSPVPPAPRGRTWIDHAPGLPHDTSKAHKDPVTGKYTPERQKLHEKIIGSFLAQAKSVPLDRKPESLFMLGTTASGKSTARKQVEPDPFEGFGAVEVDPDAVKSMLPEYRQSIALSAKDAARIVHGESSDIANEIRKRALAERKNVIVDGTGKSLSKMEKKIDDARSYGHRVSALMPHVPADECKKRADVRAEKTGRYVPHSIIEECAEKVGKNFLKLQDKFDVFNLFDNRGGPGGGWSQPKLLMSKPPSPPRVHDEMSYERFAREAGIKVEWVPKGKFGTGGFMTEKKKQQQKLDTESSEDVKPAVDATKYADWFIKTSKREAEDIDNLPSDYRVGEGIEEVLGD